MNDKCLTHWIVIGPTVWGKGKTEEEALKNAKKEYNGPLPKALVYAVAEDTYVDDIGNFVTPCDAPRPKLLKRIVGRKVELL